MSKAVEYFKSGYNCGEAMIKAFNEEKGTNIPVAIGTPFGGGLAVGTTCGSIAAAVAIIGYVKGRNDATEQNEARAYAQKLMKGINESYGTYLCKDLKKNGVSCEEIIEFTYDRLKEIL